MWTNTGTGLSAGGLLRRRLRLDRSQPHELVGSHDFTGSVANRCVAEVVVLGYMNPSISSGADDSPVDPS